MKLAVVVVALCVATVAAGAVPTWGPNWTSEQLQSIHINQGGVIKPDGSVCCPADVPQCKIQTAFMPAIVYNWFDGKKNAMKTPGGAGIVSDYNVMKEYSVTADGTCQQWCPIQQGQTVPGGDIFNPNATAGGQVTYNGQAADLFTYVTRIPIINATMETSNYYTTTGAKPMPIAEIDHITPFGESIGTQNTTYVTFVEGVPAASHFLVKNAASCKQASAKTCGTATDDDGGNGGNVNYRFARYMGTGRYFVEAY